MHINILGITHSFYYTNYTVRLNKLVNPEVKIPCQNQHQRYEITPNQ